MQAPGRLVAVLRKFFRRSVCLAPKSPGETCGKVINAHTISRAASLKHLVDGTGHLSRLLPSQEHPDRVGWRNASTFKGFCDVHDAMFKPLDEFDGSVDSELCFLAAYRAYAFEFYQKAASHDSHPSTVALAKAEGISEEGRRMLDVKDRPNGPRLVRPS